MIIFLCFQRLAEFITQLINFIFLIPDENQRSAALKKLDDTNILNAHVYYPLADLPRPLPVIKKSAQSNGPRYRSNSERHQPVYVPMYDHRPQPEMRPDHQDMHRRRAGSYDRKDLTEANKEREKAIETYNRGLKGSQPIVSVSRYNILFGQEGSAPNPTTTMSYNRAAQQPAENTAALDGQSASQTYAPPPTPSSAHLPYIGYSELQLQRQIGGGGFGTVWQGSWHATPVAIKILNQLPVSNSENAQQTLAAFEEEVAMLERLRHPNICLLIGVCWEGSHRAIITELVSRGSLWDALRAPINNIQSDGPFFWPQWLIRKILEGAGRGLIYLHRHKPPIIHRDLKSPNLLLDESFNVKICDFGLARLRDLSTVLTANVGTVQWMAPEVLTGRQYDESVDVYSLGLVAWEMMTGKCPYENMKQVEIALAVVNNHMRPPVPIQCSQQHYHFLQKCWSAGPKDRYSAEEMVFEACRIFT